MNSSYAPELTFLKTYRYLILKHLTIISREKTCIQYEYIYIQISEKVYLEVKLPIIIYYLLVTFYHIFKRF